MDLLTRTLSNIKLDTLQPRVNNLLLQLQQAGVFRALVTHSSGNKVILDTAFGPLTGKATDNLKKGDEIMVRLVSGRSEPTIKIEQHHPKQISIPNQTLSRLVQTDPAIPIVAKVVSHNNKQTLLQIADKHYPIPRQPLLQTGETLIIKPAAEKSVQLIRIQPQAILKNALSQLLPKTLVNSEPGSILELQKVAAKLLNIKPENVTVKNIGEAPVLDKNPAQISNKSSDTPVPRLTSEKPAIQQTLQQSLQNLTQPLASIEAFKPETMQQILTLLSLVKTPLSSQGASQIQAYPDQLLLLKEIIRQSPDSIKQLIRDLISSTQSTNHKLPSDTALLDTSNSFRSELLNQVEQTLTQLLVQKTSVRLQLEQNQLIQFNLNIPLQVNNENTALKIKIQEKQRNEHTDEQHWEIQLSFEFGMLGLISTHILLQGDKLSAHFWADKTSTKHLIDSQMERFKNQLKNTGFELGLFDCFVGQPTSGTETPAAISDNLVDIEV